MGHPRFRSVDVGSPQALHVHVLVGDGPDHLGSRDEHVGSAPDHEDEVGDGRGVHGSPRTGAQDHGDLGHNSRGQGVPQDDVGVATQGDDALLDPGSPRIVEADEGSSVLHGHLLELDDLFRVGLGEGAAKNGEILGEGVDQAPVDGPVSRHDPVAEDLLLLQSELHGAVGHETVQLDEGALVQQELQPFPGRKLPLLVLGLQSRLAASELGLPLKLLQALQFLVHGHGLACLLKAG